MRRPKLIAQTTKTRETKSEQHQKKHEERNNKKQDKKKMKVEEVNKEGPTKKT